VRDPISPKDDCVAQYHQPDRQSDTNDILSHTYSLGDSQPSYHFRA
jgi:hypothetical protein